MESLCTYSLYTRVKLAAKKLLRYASNTSSKLYYKLPIKLGLPKVFFGIHFNSLLLSRQLQEEW